jgi:hypothetical protein
MFGIGKCEMLKSGRLDSLHGAAMAQGGSGPGSLLTLFHALIFTR